MRLAFLGRSLRDVEVMCEMTIRLLLEALSDKRRDARGGTAKLILEIEVFAEARPCQQCRNFVCRGERLLIDREILDVVNSHLDYARQERCLGNQCFSVRNLTRRCGCDESLRPALHRFRPPTRANSRRPALDSHRACSDLCRPVPTRCCRLVSTPR